MKDGNYIEYVYAADGTRLKATHNWKIAKKKYSSNGRYYSGNLIFNGNNLRTPYTVLFPGGFYMFEGASQIYLQHLYVQDYQGNNRVVVMNDIDRSFVTSQTHYYPYGGIIGDLSTASSYSHGGDYKYSGKELDRKFGLDLYDFHARQYDAGVPWFTRPDDHAEKYYSVSPYAYCAGDPINCIDPNGREFVYDQLSEEQRKIYFDCVNLMRENSELFNKLYTAMEQSDQKVTIVFGETVNVGDCQVNAQYQSNGDHTGTITINNSLTQLKGSDLGEEVFHAFQNDNIAQYGGSCNKEFEAKTFTTAVGQECGGMQTVDGMNDYQNNILMEKYSNGDQIIIPNDFFLVEYQKYANIYSIYNKKFNIGNQNYRAATNVKPYSLLKILEK